MSDSNPQAKIRIAVNWYKKGFPGEYKAFVKQMVQARYKAGQADNESGKITEYTREIHEMPETLFTQIVKVLDTDEMKWFSTNEANRWFVKAFPEFSAAKI